MTGTEPYSESETCDGLYPNVKAGGAKGEPHRVLSGSSPMTLCPSRALARVTQSHSRWT